MGLGLRHPMQIKPRFDRKLTPFEPLTGTPVQTRNIAVLQGGLLRFRRGRRWRNRNRAADLSLLTARRYRCRLFFSGPRRCRRPEHAPL